MNYDKPTLNSVETLAAQDMLRNGGFLISGAYNFPGLTTEDKMENKKAFLQKLRERHITPLAADCWTWLYLIGEDKGSDERNWLLLEAAKEAKVVREGLKNLLRDDISLTEDGETIAEMLCRKVGKDGYQMVVIRDFKNNCADVILPDGVYPVKEVAVFDNEEEMKFRSYEYFYDPEVEAQAYAGPEVKIIARTDSYMPGMRIEDIERGLKTEGIGHIRFYDQTGRFAYRPSNAYFKGKEAWKACMEDGKLRTILYYDLRHTERLECTLEECELLEMNDGSWAFYVKPENKPGMAIALRGRDYRQMMHDINNAPDMLLALHKQGLQFYRQAETGLRIKSDIFLEGMASGADFSKVKDIVIKRLAGVGEATMQLIVEGEEIPPRKISEAQAKIAKLAEKPLEYKRNLAAVVFADILNNSRAINKKVGFPYNVEVLYPNLNDLNKAFEAGWQEKMVEAILMEEMLRSPKVQRENLQVAIVGADAWIVGDNAMPAGRLLGEILGNEHIEIYDLKPDEYGEDVSVAVIKDVWQNAAALPFKIEKNEATRLQQAEALDVTWKKNGAYMIFPSGDKYMLRCDSEGGKVMFGYYSNDNVKSFNPIVEMDFIQGGGENFHRWILTYKAIKENPGLRIEENQSEGLGVHL